MKAVIFDFNGTLFLDNDKHVQAWSEISQMLRNKPVMEKELHEKMNGLPNHMIIRYLNGGVEDEKKEQEFSALKEAIYRRLCKEDQPRFHLIDGAYDLFAKLKEAGIPFTIASASIKDNIDFFVESFHLADWIDPENIVFDDGSCPDKKAMFLKAARILNTDIQDVTVIEDSMAGIQSAIDVGVQDLRIVNSANVADKVKDLSQIRQIGSDLVNIDMNL